MSKGTDTSTSLVETTARYIGKDPDLRGLKARVRSPSGPSEVRAHPDGVRGLWARFEGERDWAPFSRGEFEPALRPVSAAVQRLLGSGRISELSFMRPDPAHARKKKELRGLGLVEKHKHLGRVIKVRYRKSTDEVEYLHATKGWRRRDYSPALMAQLLNQG